MKYKKVSECYVEFFKKKKEDHLQIYVSSKRHAKLTSNYFTCLLLPSCNYLYWNSEILHLEKDRFFAASLSSTKMIEVEAPILYRVPLFSKKRPRGLLARINIIQFT